MNTILFDNSHKLRSGWRAAIFLFVFAFAATLFGLIASSALNANEHDTSQPSNISFTVNAIVTLLSALLAGWLCGRLLEQLPFSALGAAFTKGWLKHLLLGILIGAVTLGFAVLIAFGAGGERFTFNPASGVFYSLVISFIVFAAGAAWEEALFRGYVLQTFARSDLAWLAILLTSIIFGLGHFRNPNATVISTANTILAGIWFSVAYLKTRDLWLVWGMHLMWNWMQGSVFGIEVSGLTDLTTNPLLKEIDTGPTWLTGTTYGLEGGIACTGAILLSMAVIHILPISTTENTEITELRSQ
ncbi:MAG: CPBP family intramembrane metalloprotease [Chloracidobacterium sp.]|nr:CPBP family intramembrane metalloprotease [Chloracidobacterium sp.]